MDKSNSVGSMGLKDHTFNGTERFAVRSIDAAIA
jgi:hypothetical protein